MLILKNLGFIVTILFASSIYARNMTAGKSEDRSSIRISPLLKGGLNVNAINNCEKLLADQCWTGISSRDDKCVSIFLAKHNNICRQVQAIYSMTGFPDINDLKWYGKIGYFTVTWSGNGNTNETYLVTVEGKVYPLQPKSNEELNRISDPEIKKFMHSHPHSYIDKKTLGFLGHGKNSVGELLSFSQRMFVEKAASLPDYGEAKVFYQFDKSGHLKKTKVLKLSYQKSN